jgi:hypothetical protein
VNIDSCQSRTFKPNLFVSTNRHVSALLASALLCKRRAINAGVGREYERQLQKLHHCYPVDLDTWVKPQNELDGVA